MAAVIGVIFALAVAMTAFAPQLPVLLKEGFPSPVWPPNGPTLLVRGVDDLAPAGSSKLPESALARFTASGGRSLIVAGPEGITREHYAPGLDRDTRLNSYSLVKSLVGALTLRALSDGHINSLEDSLQTYLGPAAPDVPLQAVLTMTAGLALPGEPPKTEVQKPLDDRGFSPFGPVGRLHALGIEAIVPRFLVDDGLAGAFHYQSANTALLGLVLEAVHNRPLPDILSEQIWQPAGAQDAYWRANPTTGRASAYCCLYARPVDWARVGLFLLGNGSGDQPFLPVELWQSLVAPDFDAAALRKGVYGLHMRHDVLDRDGAPLQGPFTYLMGHGGQVVYLLPEQGQVVVRFGAEPQLLHSTLYELFATKAEDVRR